MQRGDSLETQQLLKASYTNVSSFSGPSAWPFTVGDGVPCLLLRVFQLEMEPTPSVCLQACLHLAAESGGARLELPLGFRSQFSVKYLHISGGPRAHTDSPTAHPPPAAIHPCTVFQGHGPQLIT